MEKPNADGRENRIGLVLDPLDVLFFRDGRPFEAGYRLGGALPLPQTLAGALRTALLAAEDFDFRWFSSEVRKGVPVKETLRKLGAPEWIIEARFRGPWLAFLGEGAETVEPLLPVPASLAFDEDRGEWIRRDPLRDPPPGWEVSTGRDGLRPLWDKNRGAAKTPSGFLRMAGIEAFLKGGIPGPADRVEEKDLFLVDQRTGIVIDPVTLATAEGMIYSAGMIALNPGIAGKNPVKLYCEVLFPPLPASAGAPPLSFETIPLGGQSRYVVCERIEPVDWGKLCPRVEGSGERALFLLATPALFRRGWVPDHPASCSWIAAAVPPALAVSGWDVAKGGPKPTRFAVPAGSVFFMEGPVEIPESGSLCADAEDVAQGWGFTLKGAWNYV